VRTASLRVDKLSDMSPTPVPTGFAELYARHYEAVFRAALRVTGNPSDAEDALQTVFLRVLTRSEHEEAARHPAAYFRRAAVNAGVDLLRRQATRGETVYDEGAPEIATERPVLLKEQLRRALATLQNDDATLFVLRHVEGLSIEELSGVFGLEKNNVAVRLHRIRLRLQAELER
jgi:RNA polymerase sigma-70 factor (ECF subfamily)